MIEENDVGGVVSGFNWGHLWEFKDIRGEKRAVCEKIVRDQYCGACGNEGVSQRQEEPRLRIRYDRSCQSFLLSICLPSASVKRLAF